MSNKPEGPDKSAPRSSETPGQPAAGAAKKPYATLDLKAVEVKDAAKASAQSAGTSAPASASATSSSVSAKPGDVSAAVKPGDKPSATSATSATATTASGGKTSDAKPLDTKPADMKTESRAGPTASTASASTASARAEPGKPPSATAPRAEPARRGGIGGFFTHLAAGIVGGFLALLGADTIGQKLLPELGLPAPQAALTETAAQLQRRVAALEQTAAKPAAVAPEAGQKLAAAEARLAKLEEARAETAKIAAEAKALAESLAKQAAPEGAEGRVVKLEEKLAALVAAAGSDTDKGRIPQLAAITGKVTDLEATLASQLGALRKSVGEQIDTRIAAVTEASEAAKSGTLRLDRDVSTLKTDSARLRSDADRIGITLKTAQDDVAGIRSSLDGLKSDLDARLRSAAKPADVSAAVAPVANKLSALEGSVQSVVKAEESRKVNAERIVLSLELANLKRVVDRGTPFAPELAQVQKTSAGKIDLTVLDRFKDRGVAPIAELQRDFRAVANAVLDADMEPATGGVFERLVAGAKSVVRVRKVVQDANATGAEANIARMEAALKDARLADVIEEAKKLPAKATAPAQEWLAKVEARSQVDRAVAAVEAGLKSALAAGPEATDVQKK